MLVSSNDPRLAANITGPHRRALAVTVTVQSHSAVSGRGKLVETNAEDNRFNEAEHSEVVGV